MTHSKLPKWERWFEFRWRQFCYATGRITGLLAKSPVFTVADAPSFETWVLAQEKRERETALPDLVMDHWHVRCVIPECPYPIATLHHAEMASRYARSENQDLAWLSEEYAGHVAVAERCETNERGGICTRQHITGVHKTLDGTRTPFLRGRAFECER